jgi:amino-acid N-acetyltransferase
MDVVRATSTDWPAIRALLTGAGLTLDGASEAFATGLLAIEEASPVGCAAIEPYGDAALLRSVAVDAERRERGVGSGLVRAAEALARATGAGEMILLTETAAPFFGRLGYTVVDRSTVPPAVAGSVEFTTACSTTALAMRRRLTAAGTVADDDSAVERTALDADGNDSQPGEARDRRSTADGPGREIQPR